jgi:hypothetical protein
LGGAGAQATGPGEYVGTPRRWGDVYLFARRSGRDHLSGLTFYVVPVAVLNATLGPRKTVSLPLAP